MFAVVLIILPESTEILLPVWKKIYLIRCVMKNILTPFPSGDAISYPGSLRAAIFVLIR